MYLTMNRKADYEDQLKKRYMTLSSDKSVEILPVTEKAWITITGLPVWISDKSIIDDIYCCL